VRRITEDVQRLDELLKEQKRQLRDALSRAKEMEQQNDESMGGALNSRSAEEAGLAREGTEALLNKALVDQNKISVSLGGEVRSFFVIFSCRP
jgi:hypothetical protein